MRSERKDFKQEDPRPAGPAKRSRRKSAAGTCISFTGDLGIKNTASLVKALQKDTGSGAPTELKLNGISTVDLSFVQALISLGRLAKGKKPLLKGNIDLYPGPAELLKRAGLFQELEKLGYNIKISDNVQE